MWFRCLSVSDFAFLDLECLACTVSRKSGFVYFPCIVHPEAVKRKLSAWEGQGFSKCFRSFIYLQNVLKMKRMFMRP